MSDRSRETKGMVLRPASDDGTKLGLEQGQAYTC